MKKHISLTVLLTLILSGLIHGQTCDEQPFSSQVGINYQYYNDGRFSRIEGIASKWRHFLAWHNIGGDFSNPIAPPPYDPLNPNVFYPTTDTSNDPNDSDWFYYPGNNYSTGISPNLQALIASGDVELAYPSMSSTHEHISTHNIYDANPKCYHPRHCRMVYSLQWIKSRMAKTSPIYTQPI